jgi:hypothetical protein
LPTLIAAAEASDTFMPENSAICNPEIVDTNPLTVTVLAPVEFAKA